MGKRSDKPLFKIGNRVEIIPSLMSRFTGKTGVIVAVGVSQYARNLDQYTVQFEDDSEKLFWEFQLKGMGTAA